MYWIWRRQLLRFCGFLRKLFPLIMTLFSVHSYHRIECGTIIEPSFEAFFILCPDAYICITEITCYFCLLSQKKGKTMLQCPNRCSSIFSPVKPFGPISVFHLFRYMSGKVENIESNSLLSCDISFIITSDAFHIFPILLYDPKATCRILLKYIIKSDLYIIRQRFFWNIHDEAQKHIWKELTHHLHILQEIFPATYFSRSVTKGSISRGFLFL